MVAVTTLPVMQTLFLSPFLPVSNVVAAASVIAALGVPSLATFALVVALAVLAGYAWGRRTRPGGATPSADKIKDNLEINAVQAMPDGGTVTIGTANEMIDVPGRGELGPGRYIRIEITDTGMGLPADQLGRIFDPDFTAKPYQLSELRRVLAEAVGGRVGQANHAGRPVS